MPIRTIRRKEDGVMFEAIRYGGEYGEVWQGGAGLTEVRDFVLGMKTESRIDVTNEQFLEVVLPGTEFKKGRGFLQIKVKDPDTNVFRDVQHGQWILRPLEPPKFLLIIDAAMVGTDYEIVMNGRALADYQKVMKQMVPSIQSILPAIDEHTSGLAEEIADRLYREGFRKQHES